LAGADITLLDAVHYALSIGISLADTLTMVTSTPARMVGLEGKIGALCPGMPADLVHLGPDQAFLSVYQQGIRLD
jgi:N-acetylglucosamine-6-phosphate deacetylase